MTQVASTKPKPREKEPEHQFDYLLGMPFWSFSEEVITKLKSEEQSLSQQLK